MDCLIAIPHRDFRRKVKKCARVRLQNIVSIPPRDWFYCFHLLSPFYSISSDILILSMYCNRQNYARIKRKQPAVCLVETAHRIMNTDLQSLASM